MKKKLLYLCIFFLAIILLSLFLIIPKEPLPFAPTTYTTKEECERLTEKKCDLLMCDYIPPGKTFEEVCGKDFKEGWAPL